VGRFVIGDNSPLVGQFIVGESSSAAKFIFMKKSHG
jgi:hypothetical protein